MLAQIDSITSTNGTQFIFRGTAHSSEKDERPKFDCSIARKNIFSRSIAKVSEFFFVKFYLNNNNNIETSPFEDTCAQISHNSLFQTQFEKVRRK